MLAQEQIKEIITALKNDEIIIIPTDTIYGLSARHSKNNHHKINRIKKAPKHKPLITLVSNYQQLSEHVDFEDYKSHVHLLDKGVTVILPHPKKRRTMAVRLIRQLDLVEIIKQVGPLWSTSVNFHGNKPITDFTKMKMHFPRLKIFQDHEMIGHSPSKIYDAINQKWLR